MESLRKKNQTETLEIKISSNQMKNTGERHSSTLEQADERISRHEDKIDIKEKELVDRKHKSCKKYMQELSNSIKRPNL
jgi:hypothetical protein